MAGEAQARRGEVSPAALNQEAERLRQAAEARADAVENRQDETVVGGRYMVGDQLVDASGKPLKGDGDGGSSRGGGE